ncbi:MULTISPECIES: hypothetical protein [Streptomyces]|uniref:Uncharacterized protein n=2 Tax=Streptomyces TaxID=1883 RepID=A0A939FWG2_9ACTN|nr:MULTISPECIES: hypothetical protein [Streptomyces]MBO0657340.1 hypothetical protein [Streptomyces triculaminicus]QSY49348.1 hypothetical protein J3S04_31205 [Streptomyces griseocarneus]
MSGGRERKCGACNGDAVTEKEQHSVELDENGNQVAVTHRFVSACSHCSGTGTES